MKTTTRLTILGLSILSIILLMACAPASEMSEISAPAAEGDPQVISDTHLTGEPGELSDQEINHLLYMREEEKLARDVYLAMADLWGMNIFSNIANSEATHMAAVKDLLDFYSLDDPADNTANGVFTNPDLQTLYDDLVATGSQSLAEALQVGAAIEEIDILDLEIALSQTDEEAILIVFENLARGSRNHLRSFTRVYERQTGLSYEPQFMENIDYQLIINAESETNGNRSSQGNQIDAGRGKRNNPDNLGGRNQRWNQTNND